MKTATIMIIPKVLITIIFYLNYRTALSLMVIISLQSRQVVAYGVIVIVNSIGKDSCPHFIVLNWRAIADSLACLLAREKR